MFLFVLEDDQGFTFTLSGHLEFTSNLERHHMIYLTFRCKDGLPKILSDIAMLNLRCYQLKVWPDKAD